jgi:hypothetical protein
VLKKASTGGGGFLAGGTSAITVTGQALDMGTGFFPVHIVEDDLKDLIFGNQPGCQADDGPPEVPALLVERSTQEPIEAGKVLEGGGPGEPPIGGDGVAIPGQGPTPGQTDKAIRGPGGKPSLKQVQQKGVK